MSLGSTAIEALRHHRAKQIEDRLLKGGAWQDLDLVFCNELGDRSKSRASPIVTSAPHLKKAGLPGIMFHDLRHTAATLMLDACVQVKVVSEILGHSQSAFTMDRYQHTRFESLRQRVERLKAF